MVTTRVQILIITESIPSLFSLCFISLTTPSFELLARQEFPVLLLVKTQNKEDESFLYLRKKSDLIILTQMSREITIIKKEEAYSYDEVNFLEEKLLPLIADEKQKEATVEVLSRLKASLENQKTSAAIFFMPQNTFNIFSLIQGDNSICKIEKENIEAIYSAFDLIDDFEKQPIYKHLQQKIQTLKEYLQQGNTVTPTVIAADSFTVMEVE